ncbi:MAG TPA: hypothetical protein VJJ77_07285 [Dongiaceae bacterium]|nr:hypothetical protein [Dongiaceae bacterium]
MIDRSRRRAMGVLLLAAVAACSTSPKREQFAELTYAHLPPFRLDVAVVDVIDETRPTTAAPNVAHLFPVAPATAAARWAKDRLVAVGTSGSVRYTIVEASAIEAPLERTTGLKGMFTIDQSERYDAAIEVRLTVQKPAGQPSVTVTVRAERSQTVPEDITLNEREKLWFDLTEGLMTDLDARLEKDIRQHLATYLR